MNGPLKTVLFDFGGTLDSDGLAWKERCYTYYQGEGLEMSTDAFDASFFAADNPLVGNIEPATDLSGTVRALVANLETELTRRGVGPQENGTDRAPKDSNRGGRVAARFLSEASAAFARNRPVLSSLSERYNLGVVSNFYGNLEAVCHRAGLGSFFGALVDSHRAGAKKPDPAIFRVALEKLGAVPETTVLVGDSLRRDREGARRTGMRFIWVAPQSVQAAHRAASTGAPKEAVTELRGVLELLQ